MCLLKRGWWASVITVRSSVWDTIAIMVTAVVIIGEAEIYFSLVANKSIEG